MAFHLEGDGAGDGGEFGDGVLADAVDEDFDGVAAAGDVVAVPFAVRFFGGVGEAWEAFAVVCQRRIRDVETEADELAGVAGLELGLVAKRSDFVGAVRV